MVTTKPASIKALFIFADSSVKHGLADPAGLKALLETYIGTHDAKMEIYVTYARSLSFFISNDKVVIRDHRNHRALEKYDFVYFRKAGTVMQQMLTAALYLKDHGVPFFDHEIATTTSRNKLSQMYMLQRAGLPVPTTLYCRNNRRLLRLVSERYRDRLQFPLIVKATGGSRGDANYLVNSLDSLRDIVANEKRHFLIQEFIPNNGDLRFFVAGGVLSGIIGRKSADGSHLNNTSKGGEATLLNIPDMPDVVKHNAVIAAEVFGRDCAGVDIIFDKNTGDHYILEVNRAPQIEGASFENDKARWLVRSIRRVVKGVQVRTNGKETVRFGWLEAVNIADNHKVVAKIDTGAYSSSVHATMISEKNAVLECMIGQQRMTFDVFTKKRIKSSNGLSDIRYMIVLPVAVGGVEYSMNVTLTDRSDMHYDMLIGRKFLRKYHIVTDVSRRYIASGKRKGDY